jgi:DNA repair exonuclease SbcCD nuclease subunit
MIIAGDFHLGLTSDSILVDGIPSRLVDAKTRLIEVVRAAEGDDGILIIPGDLFHKVWLDPMTVDAALQAFYEAGKRKIDVYLLPGNHDCDVRWSATILAKGLRKENIIEVDSPRYIKGVGFFLPHMPRSKEIEFLKKEKSYKEFFLNSCFTGGRVGGKIAPLFSHAHVKGATNSYGFDVGAGGMAMEFVPKEFPSFFSVAVFSHIHRHQVIPTGKDYNVVYTGPAITTRFDESTVEKGYIKLDAKTSDWKFVPYTSKVQEYRHVKINLLERKGVINLDEERIKKTLSGNLLKITIFARSAFQVDESGLRKIFNKYATVMRVEYKIERLADKEEGTKGKKTISLDSLNHMSLFKSFVRKSNSSYEVKDRAIEIGREIIKECCVE